MSKVILGVTMSLDGFIADRNGDVSLLFPDLEELIKTDLMLESIRTTGAVVMGRHAYDMAQGDFTGYEFQVPIFVLTHHVPEKAARGENEKLSFTFVTDGLASAIEKAIAAAGDKNVTVIGGADTFQQCINAGLFDILEIGVMPVLFGDGLRLFDHLNGRSIELERVNVLQTGSRTDLYFRKAS